MQISGKQTGAYVTGQVAQRDPEILHDDRVGDAGRRKVQDHLATQYTEGRLSHDAYMARMNMAAEATTVRQLNGLLGDLPGFPEPPAPRSWITYRRRVALHLAALAACLAAAVAGCAAAFAFPGRDWLAQFPAWTGIVAGLVLGAVDLVFMCNWLAYEFRQRYR